MMFVSLVLAMVFGPWQLWLLASFSRTIAFRTVLSSILAGVAVAFPVTVAIEWAWISAAARLWGGFRFELVEWAGWTVDPFVEEVARLLPLVLVLGFVAQVRRQWSLSDFVVFGTGVGSGYRLAEHVARFAEESRGPLAGLSDSGWVVGWTFDGTLIVPYPWVLSTQWIPAGVQSDALSGDPLPVLSHNVIAVWGAFGGLAVGLCVLSGRRPVPLARAWVHWATAVGLITFAGLAHAQANADLIGADWGFPALALPRLLEPFYWAWPVVVLVAAVFIDWRLMKSQRTDPLFAPLRIGSDESDVASLVRLSMQRPLVAVRPVLSFVRARRALAHTLAMDEHRPGDDSAGVSLLFEALQPMAFQLCRQLQINGDLWSRVESANKTARHDRRSALLRSPAAWVLVGLSLLFVLVPVAYFVVGTSAGGYRTQEWMSGDGSVLTIGLAAVGVVVGAVMIVLRLRTFRQMPQLIAEPRARAILAVAVTTAAVGSMVFGLFQIRSGATLDATVYRAHGLDALGSKLWATALNLGLLALVAVNPVTGWPWLVEHHRFKSSDELLAMLPWQLQLLARAGHNTISADDQADRATSESLQILISSGAPIPPRTPDELAVVAIGFAVITGAGVVENVEIFGSNPNQGPPPNVDINHHQYTDIDGVLRWKDTNQEVSITPNRPLVQDPDGTWRWADTGQPMSGLESASPVARILREEWGIEPGLLSGTLSELDKVVANAVNKPTGSPDGVGARGELAAIRDAQATGQQVEIVFNDPDWPTPDYRIDGVITEIKSREKPLDNYRWFEKRIKDAGKQIKGYGNEAGHIQLRLTHDTAGNLDLHEINRRISQVGRSKELAKTDQISVYANDRLVTEWVRRSNGQWTRSE